jgi:hypothetical protein
VLLRVCLRVPPPLPRRVVRSLGGCLRSRYVGLPRVRVGSALATAFRGLLRVHSRYGPRIRGPPQEDFCPDGSTAPVTRDRPPVATRLYRQLPRQDLRLLERVTFHGTRQRVAAKRRRYHLSSNRQSPLPSA